MASNLISERSIRDDWNNLSLAQKVFRKRRTAQWRRETLRHQMMARYVMRNRLAELFNRMRFKTLTLPP